MKKIVNIQIVPQPQPGAVDQDPDTMRTNYVFI